MPPERTIKRSVAKVRSPAHSNPNFDRKQDIVFNQETLDYRGSSCLIFDSGRDDVNRFLIFSNDQLMMFASRQKNFQMDGTFSFAPKCYNNGKDNLSGQVYSIHARKGILLVPCFYILMAKKTKVEYNRIFAAIQSLVELEVEKVMLDLELGAIASITESFPGACISLCYYHFQESLFSWVSENNMKSRYLNSQPFRNLVHLHGALAFVPATDVIDVWNQLCSFISTNFEDDVQVDDFNAYFEKSFVGRPQNNGQRRPPRYALEMWNQHENVLSQMSRTNNGVEGWHNGLNHLGDCAHPNLYRFIEIIKKDMDKSRLKIEENEAGHVPPPRRVTYVDFDVRVRNVVLDYSNECAMDFLENIATMFHFY